MFDAGPGLIALGALYLVGTQGRGLAQAFGGAEQFVSGTLMNEPNCAGCA